jgi:geranylgeranylglycerol-phosphate geranylgeranyltransferase
VETTKNPSPDRMRQFEGLTPRLGGYLTLVRLPNCIMIGLAVVVGETIALGALPSASVALLGFLTASLLLAGAMVFNDIRDIQVDRVNSPDRPLPSGKVTIGEAYALSTILSVLAIVSSALLGIWTLATALVALVLMSYYSTRGKKTGLLGNAVVSFNVALPFLFGGLAVGGTNLRPLLFIFFLLAFLANTSREVAKGIPDVEGDRVKGIKTVAVRSGVRSAARVTAALFVVAVLLSFVAPLLDHNVSVFYYPLVVIADLGFLYSSYRLLRDQTPKTVKSVKTQVLLWMLLGLVGFLMGGSSVL